MRRTGLKISAAPSSTRWTLTSSQSDLISPVGNMSPTMNRTHGMQEDEGYGTYSPTIDRTSSSGWKPGPFSAQTNGHASENVEYNTPVEERSSYQMSLNTRPRTQNQDSVSKHLLHETALLDTQGYEILTIDEVDALKKEHERLKLRLDTAQRKLAFECKVRDAAQNLQRLHSSGSRKERADTPQSPDSPKRPRRSLLGQRRPSSSSSENKSLDHADEELAISVQKVDEINEVIKNILDRRQNVERKLLRHTAAVLAEKQDAEAMGNANGMFDDGTHSGASSIYSPDEFDGIRDILCGAPAHSINKLQKRLTSQRLQEEHEDQLHSMQLRLERLNDQLRSVISEAGRSRGVSIPPEPRYGQIDERSPAGKLTTDFDRLENNLRHLQQEQQDSRSYYARLQDNSHTTASEVEQQLESLNTQLHDTLQRSSAAMLPDLQKPPPATGNGYLPQLAYLEECFGKLTVHTKKNNEYEATLGGLWEILQSENPSAIARNVEDTSDDNAASPPSPAKESFSLQAFSTRVQHIFDRATSAREQQDILRRQVQQQRELNGKSDAEKDKQIEELNCKHVNLVSAHDSLQDQFAKVMASHTQSQGEVSHLRAEILNVENELEQLRRTAESKGSEREEMARQLQEQQTTAAALHGKVQDLEAQMEEMKDSETKHAEISTQLDAATSARDMAEGKHTALGTEMQNLENEVVRLTTELAMAKAELDGAYGSRAERAKEAQASEVQTLNAELDALRKSNAELESELQVLRSASPPDSSRTQLLEQELTSLTSEYQELTRESLQMEHERTQLDYLIDGLRDRVESLEGQLSDERVRWIGAKSPATAGSNPRESVGRGGEGVSVAVLRQEFKRMMRETRAEGVRALKTEQEHRRALETELRRFRQGRTASLSPAGRPSTPNGNLTPSVSHTASSPGTNNGLTVNGHGRGASTASSTSAAGPV